jgi:hypothetical protein
VLENQWPWGFRARHGVGHATRSYAFHVGLTDRFQPIAEHRGLYAPNRSALEAISSKVGLKPVEFGVKQRPALRVVAGAK